MEFEVKFFFFLSHLITWVVRRTVDGAYEPTPIIYLADESPVRGQFAHGTNGKVTSEFWGIPYAEPPVGNLRFRKPVPKASWKHVFNASTQPNSCIQTRDTQFNLTGNIFFGADMWNANTRKDEDCLYLNIWYPGRIDPKNMGKKKKVMIWVYGGGFWSGTSTLDIYDGKIFSTEEDVIIVSMNYRVTIFGFLYTGRDDSKGNQGLWDQLLSFKWVKKHIHKFGGDPDDVTIFGESAGAASVSMHVVSRQSSPYFTRAVLQSSSVTAPWAMDSQEKAKLQALKISEALKCNVTKRDEKPDWDKLMDCLRNEKADRLREYEWQAFEFCDFPWTPVVDGDFFDEDPKKLLKDGNFKKTELIVGTNFDESMYFLVYHLQSIFNMTRMWSTTEFVMNDEMFRFGAEKSLPVAYGQRNPVVRDAIIFEYTDYSLPETPHKRQQALDKMLGDYHFTCSINEFAYWFSKHGGKVYYYYFTHRASMQTWPAWMGVLHGYEINFIFGEPLNSVRYNYTTKEKELSRRFMRFWANFARTGNPNTNPDGRSTEVMWPLWEGDGKQEYLEMSTTSTATGIGPRRRQCAFWRDYVPKLYTATSENCTIAKAGAISTISAFLLASSILLSLHLKFRLSI